MPNSNPQAILIANTKIRPLADRFARLYNAMKSAQIEFIAEGWGTLFPNDSEVIVDGSATDGRTPITNADVRAFMLTDALGFVNMTEGTEFAVAAANVTRDRVFKISPNPEG